MNLVANSGEQQSNLLFVNFNQDCTSLAVGSKSGYKLFSLGTIERLEQIYENESEDVCIVERLFSSSLVAIVSLQHPRKLKVCHFKKGTEICNYSYSNSILAVKLNRQRLIVCLEESLYIHNIRDMKVLHTIRDTPANPHGLCALSISNDNCYLAYPGSNQIGEVQIFDTVNLRAVTMIPAHDNPLAALTFSPQGTKLATASEKGTVIRVFSIPDGQKLFEFRRGVKRCVSINALSFSVDALFLCTSSNTETVHIFKLESPKEKPADESNTWMSMMGQALKSSATYLPVQVTDMFNQGRSFATAHLPVAGMKNVCTIATIQKLPRVLVASQDGTLYVYNLDPNEGGECALVKQHRLDGLASEGSSGDQQSHDRPLTHLGSGGAAAATGTSPPASYAATARRADSMTTFQPLSSTGKPSGPTPARWTGESYAEILKRRGGPQELEAVAILDHLLQSPDQLHEENSVVMSTLIGVPDCLIKENETTTWQTNKIGGFPDWMYQEMDIPHCGCCGQPMILVVQLYCPLTNSLYHRCLYIFVCLKRVCASQIQGWKVFRMQILDKPLSSQVGRESVASKDWNEGHDDWGEGQHDWGETNDDFREGQNDLEEHQDDLGDDQNDWGESQNNLVDGQNEWKEAACREEVYASVTSTALRETEHFAQMNLQDVPVAEDCHCSTDTENNSGEVVAETLALDKTSLQRIINLLAVQQNDTNLQESLSEKDEVICSRDIVFPAWYINVFNETTEDSLSEFSDHLTSLLRDYEQREGKSIKCVLADNLSDKHGSTSVEVYEKAEVKHGDKQCHKFIMKLQSCPQQCVRYHWNSSPLLISRPIHGKVLADKCLTCGSERVFELQLLPYLISLLKLPGQIESTVEFGTVLVYTCKSSCWSETSLWHEECIILQQDPDHHLFHC